MSRADRVSAILADEDFRGTVKALEDQLTRKVMGRQTSSEDRADALNQYHALQAVIASLRSVASDKEETST